MNPETTPASISVFDWQEMKRLQAGNEQQIAALINAIDGLRLAIQSGFADVNKQLAALREDNRVMLDLLNSRLPEGK